MTDLESILRRAAAILDGAAAAWALIGGLAVSVRGEPRLTRDVDIAVAVADDQDAETTVRKFGDGGFRIQSLLEQSAVDRLSTVRLGTASGAEGPVLDLLFASSGIEVEIAEEAEKLEVLPGLFVPVATAGHLIALKLLARSEERPQDDIDLVGLVTAADDQTIADAQRAVGLISSRGFARGRDLESDLSTLVSQHSNRKAEILMRAATRPSGVSTQTILDVIDEGRAERDRH